jgi:nucleotide-binding universal stress UspA family protein
MTPFTSILAATDFSVDGNHAVRRAALLAHAHGARLHILHVLKPAGCKPLREWFSSPTIDLDLKAAQARDALRRVAVEIAGAYDVTAQVEIEVGDVHETLMRASEQADLVVLGQRGRSGLEGWLARRTVDRMLRTCRRPILVVKTAADAPYRRVMAPIDFTAYSDTALRVAAALPPVEGLHVFHAIDSPRTAVLSEADVPEHIIREARIMEESGAHARMRRKAAQLDLDSARMSFSLAHGPAARSILRQAHHLGADLIVAGKHGRSTVGSFLLGHVSRRVLSECACDMLIVPQPRGPSQPRAASANWTRNSAHFVSGRSS